MKQLQLFKDQPKYTKPATHKPNPYVILGQWGLAHLAKCSILMGDRGAPNGHSETSDHRERPSKPRISSVWKPPADSGE